MKYVTALGHLFPPVTHNFYLDGPRCLRNDVVGPFQTFPVGLKKLHIIARKEISKTRGQLEIGEIHADAFPRSLAESDMPTLQGVVI